MAFVRANLPGWALFEILTSAQMNALDIDHANAIDGAGGGTYAPTTPIIIGGAGLHVTGGTVLDDTTFTGDVFFENGFNVNDNLTVNDQGDLDVDGDTTLDNVTIDGEFLCNDNDPVFSQGLTVNGLGVLATNVAASLVLSSSGDLSVTDDATIGGDLAVSGLATLASLLCGPAILGDMQVNGKLQLNGAGRLQFRAPVAGTDANVTVSVSTSDALIYNNLSVLTANRVVTIDDVGAEDGMIYIVSRVVETGGNTLAVHRSDASSIAVMGAGGFCIVMRSAGRWQAIAVVT